MTESNTCLLEGTLGCNRVVASESFVVTPGIKIITRDVCVPNEVNLCSVIGIVDPKDCFITTNGSLVGRTL